MVLIFKTQQINKKKDINQLPKQNYKIHSAKNTQNNGSEHYIC